MVLLRDLTKVNKMGLVTDSTQKKILRKRRKTWKGKHRGKGLKNPEQI